MNVLEKNIEGEVVRWALKRGFLCPKVKFVEVGYPDRLFISPEGHTIFIEFKRPGKKPEPIQQYRLSQLRMRKIPAYWCDTYVAAVNILKAALEPEELPQEGHPPAVVTSIRRAIVGSRSGKDFHRSSYDQNSKGEIIDQSSSGGGSPPTDDDNLA